MKVVTVFLTIAATAYAGYHFGTYRSELKIAILKQDLRTLRIIKDGYFQLSEVSLDTYTALNDKFNDLSFAHKTLQYQHCLCKGGTRQSCAIKPASFR